MRQKIWLLLAVSVLPLFLGATAVGQRNRTEKARRCGTVVDGVTLCLSRSAEPGSVTLEVRNAGAKDAVLNLGIMLANGARQYPSAITLTLSDARGKVHEAVLAGPAIIAGRLDPLIVPLPHGASLRLPLDLTKYLLYAPGQLEDLAPDPTKPYKVQAKFTGKGVSQAEANLDVKGLALMPYWTGIVVSNTVATNQR